MGDEGQKQKRVIRHFQDLDVYRMAMDGAMTPYRERSSTCLRTRKSGASAGADMFAFLHHARSGYLILTKGVLMI